MMLTYQSYAQYHDIETYINNQLVVIYNIYPSNKPLPKLVIDTDNNISAYFNNSDHIPIIHFNIKTYQLSKSFKKDSTAFIAFILTHELYHYYNNINNDAKHSCWAAVLNSNEKIDHHKTEEALADYNAAVYSYMAGFDIYNQIPNFIDSIYFHFNLPDTISGYPTKSERKEGIKKSESDFINFCHIYNLSKLLYLIEDFDGSIQCNLELINKNINNISIYNNIGICYLQKALKLFSIKEEPNPYPIEFDSKNRFNYTDKRQLTNDLISDSIIRIRINYLNIARNYFNKSLAINFEYESALLNIAIINCINGNYGSVIDYYQSNSEKEKPFSIYFNYLIKTQNQLQLKNLQETKLYKLKNESLNNKTYTNTTFHSQHIINNKNEGLENSLESIDKTLTIGSGKLILNNAFIEYSSLSEIIRFKKEKIVFNYNDKNSIALEELIEYYGTATEHYIVSMSNCNYIVYPLYGTILYTNENNIYMILYKKMER